MVVPVALAHAGWVALQLRQTLGNRIPKLVFLEWIILDAPPPFLLALKETHSPGQWKQTIDPMFSRWLHGVDNPKLIRFVRDEMGSYGFEMWSRAGHEISTALKAMYREKSLYPPGR